MKQRILFLVFLTLFIGANSQPLPDSIKTRYRSAKTNEQKGECLTSYFATQLTTDSSTAGNTLALLDWFGKQNDQAGKDYTNLKLSGILTAKGDFPASLNLLFSVLSRFEERKDNFGIGLTYRAIGSTYMSAKDYTQAAEYLKKQVPLASAITRKTFYRGSTTALPVLMEKVRWPIRDWSMPKKP